MTPTNAVPQLAVSQVLPDGGVLVPPPEPSSDLPPPPHAVTSNESESNAPASARRIEPDSKPDMLAASHRNVWRRGTPLPSAALTPGASAYRDSRYLFCVFDRRGQRRTEPPVKSGASHMSRQAAKTALF